MIPPRHRPLLGFFAATVLIGLTLYASLSNVHWPIYHPWDKALHGGGYFVLLLSLAWLQRPDRYYSLAASLAVMGGAVELLQSQLPARGMSAADFAANLGGICLGTVVLLLCRRFCRSINTAQ